MLQKLSVTFTVISKLKQKETGCGLGKNVLVVDTIRDDKRGGVFTQIHRLVLSLLGTSVKGTFTSFVTEKEVFLLQPGTLVHGRHSGLVLCPS